MLLVGLLGCAVESTTIGLCGPSGRFVLPEPDYVVLDDARSVQVEAIVACTERTPQVTWQRGDDLDSGELALVCEADGEWTRCDGELATDELAACSGEGAWTTLHLLLAPSEGGEATELDEVGIPFAGRSGDPRPTE